MTWTDEALCRQPRHTKMRWTIDANRKRDRSRDFYRSERAVCEQCPVIEECETDWRRWRRNNPNESDLEIRFGTIPDERRNL